MEPEEWLDLMTLEEVADFCRTSVHTVKYWIHMRKLKSIKLGKRRLVRRSELIAHVMELENKSA